MVDPAARTPNESTTYRERATCVIEHRLSSGQRLSCELNQVLTLRGRARSESEGSVVVRSNHGRKV